ncbi:MAG: CBS domain-containing protein [Haloarculaceae archaeon]
MPVSAIARRGVMTAETDQSAGNLASVMREEAVGSVVIVSEDRPVGIVTDRDLVIEVLEPRRDPSSVTAGDIMTETPATVTADQGVFEATATLFEFGVRRLPVVDDDGAMTGIVTLDDVLVLLTDELGNLAGVVEAESPPY